MVLKQTYNKTSLKMLYVHVCWVLSITFHAVPFEDMGIIIILYYGKLGFGFLSHVAQAGMEFCL